MDRFQKMVSLEIQKFKERIRIPAGLNHGDIESFFQSILTNDPLTFNVNGCRIIRTLFTVTLVPNYVMEKPQYESLVNECRLIGERLSNVINNSDPHIFLNNLHHEIYKKVIYLDFSHAHSIVGPLIYKKGVCEGISKMTKYICDLNDVECCIIVGELEGMGPHAWNQVKLDEEWYNVDYTLDLTISDDEHELFDYFLVNDETFLRNHIFETVTKGCNCSKYDSEYRAPRLFSSKEVRKALSDGVKEGKKTINLTIEDAEEHIEDIERIINQELASIDHSWIHPENSDYFHIFLM